MVGKLLLISHSKHSVLLLEIPMLFREGVTVFCDSLTKHELSRVWAKRTALVMLKQVVHVVCAVI